MFIYYFSPPLIMAYVFLSLLLKFITHCLTLLKYFFFFVMKKCSNSSNTSYTLSCEMTFKQITVSNKSFSEKTKYGLLVGRFILLCHVTNICFCCGQHKIGGVAFRMILIYDGFAELNLIQQKSK